MSLFKTGFGVDSSVPVASTSTHPHQAGGSGVSLNHKRKRGHGGGAGQVDDEQEGSSITVNASPAKVASAKPDSSKALDVDASRSEVQSVQAQVNIEKLMKKLQRMEKGENGDSSTSNASSKNKKQKQSHEDASSQTTAFNNAANKGKAKSTSTPRGENGTSTNDAATTEGDTGNPATKKKQQKKKNKKDAAAADKPAYVPDEAALALREERKLKKAARAGQPATSTTGTTSTSTFPPHVDADAVSATAGPEDSIMNIDTMEEVAVVAAAPAVAESVESAPVGPEAPSQAFASTSAPVPAPMSTTKPAPEKKNNKKNKAKANGVAIVDTAPEPIQEVVEAEVPAPSMVKEAGMTDLQKRMQKKLGGARFRWINEQLYTASGKDALSLMEEDASMFNDYHSGFHSQAVSWPSQPIQIFMDYFRSTYASSPNSSSKPIIADLGCGKAELAATLVPLGFSVLSFDLVDQEPYVIKAQCTERLPLPGSSKETDNSKGAIVQYVVCCLSLMGSDWLGMIREARRVLRNGGKLKIAEVKSRFSDVKAFINLVATMGFKLTSQDASNTHFILFDFKKVSLNEAKASSTQIQDDEKVKLSQDLLKPCIYKRR